MSGFHVVESGHDPQPTLLHQLAESVALLDERACGPEIRSASASSGVIAACVSRVCAAEGPAACAGAVAAHTIHQASAAIAKIGCLIVCSHSVRPDRGAHTRYLIHEIFVVSSEA